MEYERIESNYIASCDIATGNDTSSISVGYIDDGGNFNFPLLSISKRYDIYEIIKQLTKQDRQNKRDNLKKKLKKVYG